MPDEPPWTRGFMKKKSEANKKRRPTTVGSGRLVRRLRGALWSAICIIRNEAMIHEMNRQNTSAERLQRWADELKAEGNLRRG